MSAKPSADAQTSLRRVSRCKGTTKFADLQENSIFFAIFSLEESARRLQFRI